MLSFSLSDFMWAKGRTEPISGTLYDEEGSTVDLTGKTLSMLVKQGTTATLACSTDEDVVVALRDCPEPSETYPNDAMIFGDATLDFPTVMLPGNFVYFQKTGDLEIHTRKVHFVNNHYITLFLELPEVINSDWAWWASKDNPTAAERGKFQFLPDIATMDNGSFDSVARLVDGSETNYSSHLTGRVTTPIQP